MKKSSKNLMKIVAILLCLVLATSSIVSTTLAKFVVSKDATTSITFDTFGLSIDVSAPELGEGTVTEQKGDSASITFNNLQMRPGMKKDNMIRFVLTDNEPTVPVNLVIKVDVTTHEKCVVPASTELVTSDTAFMPIAFTVGTIENKTDNQWASEKNTAALLSASSNTNLDDVLEKAIAAKIAELMGVTTTDNTVTKPFLRAGGKADGEVSNVTFANSEKGIAFGFNWPLENDITDGDFIETYLAKQLDGVNPITITYTISMEQAGV